MESQEDNNPGLKIWITAGFQGKISNMISLSTGSISHNTKHLSRYISYFLSLTAVM